MGLPVREYRPVRDKVSRARTASIRYEGGTIYHLQHASWLVDYEMELLGFPTTEHDDQVDVTSRAAEIVVGDVEPNIRDFEPSKEDLAALAELKKEERKRKYVVLNPEDDWDELGEEIEHSTLDIRI